MDDNSHYSPLPKLWEFQAASKSDESLVKDVSVLASILGAVVMGSLLLGAWSVGDQDAVDVAAPRFVQVQP